MASLSSRSRHLFCWSDWYNLWYYRNWYLVCFANPNIIFEKIPFPLNSTAIASTGGLLLYRIAKSRGDFLGRVEVWTNSKFGSDSARTLYIPLDHSDGSNPGIPVEEPLPGVFIYRVRQSPLYPGIGSYTDQLVQVIQAQTRRTSASSYPRLGDRPWNVSFFRIVNRDIQRIEFLLF